VVEERRETYRLVAGAPGPLDVGRTVALAASLLGAACVLALAVAGLPSRVGTPPSSHSVSGALGYVVVAAVSMGFVVSLGLAAGARARARLERRSVPGLRLSLLQRPLVIAVVAAAIAAPVLMVVVPFRSAHTGQSRTPPPTAQPRTTPAPASPDRVHWPSLAAAAAGAALAILVLALIVRGDVRRSSAAAEGAELTGAIDAGIAALESETDPRRGVIRAYAVMEKVLGERGVGRHVAETPVEYLRRVLVRVEAGAAAAARLTSLYESAKFSSHEIDESMRQDAVAALRTLRSNGDG